MTDGALTAAAQIAGLRRGLVFAGAGRRCEIEARIAALEALPQAARDVPVGASWAFTEHRSLAETATPPAPAPPRRRCAFPGCDRPVRPGPSARYCGDEHASEMLRRQKRQASARYNAAAKAVRGAQRQRVTAAKAPEDAPPQWRQDRPRYRLITDPTLRILPPLPAPLRRFTNGLPTPFQDDLRAQRDHGSPGTQAGLPSDIGLTRQAIR